LKGCFSGCLARTTDRFEHELLIAAFLLYPEDFAKLALTDFSAHDVLFSDLFMPSTFLTEHLA